MRSPGRSGCRNREEGVQCEALGVVEEQDVSRMTLWILARGLP